MKWVFFRVDELIDVIQGNRVYIPCLYVYNKIDQICMEEVDRYWTFSLLFLSKNLFELDLYGITGCFVG